MATDITMGIMMVTVMANGTEVVAVAMMVDGMAAVTMVVAAMEAVTVVEIDLFVDTNINARKKRERTRKISDARIELATSRM